MNYVSSCMGLMLLCAGTLVGLSVQAQEVAIESIRTTEGAHLRCERVDGRKQLALMLYGESGRYQIHAQQTEPGQWAFVVDDIRYVCPLGFARCETADDLEAGFDPNVVPEIASQTRSRFMMVDGHLLLPLDADDTDQQAWQDDADLLRQALNEAHEQKECGGFSL